MAYSGGSIYTPQMDQALREALEQLYGPMARTITTEELQAASRPAPRTRPSTPAAPMTATRTTTPTTTPRQAPASAPSEAPIPAPTKSPTPIYKPTEQMPAADRFRGYAQASPQDRTAWDTAVKEFRAAGVSDSVIERIWGYTQTLTPAQTVAALYKDLKAMGASREQMARAAEVFASSAWGDWADVEAGLRAAGASAEDVAWAKSRRPEDPTRPPTPPRPASGPAWSWKLDPATGRYIGTETTGWRGAGGGTFAGDPDPDQVGFANVGGYTAPTQRWIETRGRMGGDTSGFTPGMSEEEFWKLVNPGSGTWPGPSVRRTLADVLAETPETPTTPTTPPTQTQWGDFSGETSDVPVAGAEFDPVTGKWKKRRSLP